MNHSDEDQTDSNEGDESDEDFFHTALGPECFEFTPSNSAQGSPERSNNSDSVFATPVNSPPRRRRRTMSEDCSFPSRSRDSTPGGRRPSEPLATSTPVRLPEDDHDEDAREKTAPSSHVAGRKMRTRSENAKGAPADLMQRLNCKMSPF